jgi:hypothetical protein
MKKKDEGIFLGQGKVVATYPSGKLIETNGKLYFGAIPNSDEVCPSVFPDNKPDSVMILDPKAVITIDGKITFHPRGFLSHLAPWVKDWLENNKEWAKLGSFEGMEATGAWPNGTRIRKIYFEHRDRHKIGDQGTVLGSVFDTNERYVYSIAWVDDPTVPVACLGYKIEKSTQS